jgi:signal transduction histidine kinase
MARLPAGKISIRWILTALTTIPLLGVGLVLLWMSTRTTATVSQRLGQQLLTQIQRQTETSVQSYLDRAVRASDFFNRLVIDGVARPDNLPEWRARLVAHLAAQRELSSITFANMQNDSTYVMRYPPDAGFFEYGLSDGSKPKNNCRAVNLSADNLVLPGSEQEYTYDPVSRPWHQLARGSDKPAWSEPYFWFNEERRASDSEMGIGYVRTVVDRDGTKMGYLSIDIAVSQFSALLRQLGEEERAYLLLVDNSGRILGTSDPKKPMVGLTTAELLETSTNPIEKAIAELKLDAPGRTIGQESIAPSGQVHWIRQARIRLTDSVSAKLIIALPESNIMAEPHQAIRWLTLFGLIYLGFVVVGSLLLARLIAKPLTRLTTMARAVGEGQFDQRVNVQFSRELTQLSNSLNDMAQGLSERVKLLSERNAAEESSRLKSRLVSHVSHEFRTPINAIDGYVDLMQDQAERDGREHDIQDLKRIRQASKHLLAMVNNILDLSRIEAGKQKAELSQFPVQKLIDGLIDTIQPLAARGSNRLVVDCPPDLQLVSDPMRLRQVLLNLLSNAAKFTDNGTITLAVAPSPKHIAFIVQDTGRGMSQEQMQNLFEAFYQVHSNDAPKGLTGSGLGLSITKQIVEELLQGNISVQSQPGVGSRFEVRLPLDPPTTKATNPPSQSTTSLQSEKVEL